MPSFAPSSLTPTSSLSTASYVILGLATCFWQEDGELQEMTVIEPVPSAAWKALHQGLATSYQRLLAVSIGAIVPTFEPDNAATAQTPEQWHKPTGWEASEWGADFYERLVAAARTYQHDPSAIDLLAIGETWETGEHYSVARKRILNHKRKVKTSDNVKQHAHTHKKL